MIKVKPLNWREIDPGRCYVGTGHGFTCEVRLLHSGIWEVSLPTGRIDSANMASAQTIANSAYSKAILSCIEEPQP